MSVIMGIKTNNVVILGADKQLSTYNNEFISDDDDKILVINSNLAMAFAGNAAIQKAIEIDTDKIGTNKQLLYVEDAINILCSLFERLKMAEAKTILSTSSCVIIGGLSKDKSLKLLAFSYVQGKLSWSEVKEDKILFPPNDVSMKKCAEIFIENFYLCGDRIIEKTVQDISKISKVVSVCGNKWIYDNRTHLSEKRNF
ncbi:MAG: hypothetical protein ACLVCT_02890 [Lachnospira sp.]